MKIDDNTDKDNSKNNLKKNFDSNNLNQKNSTNNKEINIISKIDDNKDLDYKIKNNSDIVYEENII